jgi:hypothetical protein
MKTYNEVKQEELVKTANYTKSDFNKSINLLKVASMLFTEGVMFVVTLIPFLIGIWFLNFILPFAIILLVAHFIYYTYFAKGVYLKKIAPDKESIKTIIDVLVDIRDEKYSK